MARMQRPRRLMGRAATYLAERTGNVQRLTEAKALFDRSLRQEIRDEVAMRAVLAAVLRPDSDAVDVGASVGDVLEQFVHLAPAGRHVAYEPIPGQARRLAARFPQVQVRQAALAEANGTETFQHVVSRPAFSGLRLRPDVPGESVEVDELVVDVRRLDDDLPEDVHPALIKIDVEGGEVGVVAGATKTLERFQPVVLFEHASVSRIYGTSSGQLWDLFDGCQYQILSAEGAGPYDRDEFQDHSGEPRWNYMAIPR